MKAVHFGAGNIGRGFVGLLLHKAGYDLVFADVAEALIASLKDADSYVVHEVGEDPRAQEVRGFSALNSGAEPEALRRPRLDRRRIEPIDDRNAVEAASLLGGRQCRCCKDKGQQGRRQAHRILPETPIVRPCSRL